MLLTTVMLHLLLWMLWKHTCTLRFHAISAWDGVVNSTLRPLYPRAKNPCYLLNRNLVGLQSRCELFGEEESCMRLPGVEPLYRAANSPVTIPTEPSQRLITILASWWWVLWLLLLLLLLFLLLNTFVLQHKIVCADVHFAYVFIVLLTTLIYSLFFSFLDT
jgi:hypothetical protein